MDHGNHVEVVGKALELEKQKEKLETRLRRQKNQQFRGEKPQLPVRKQAVYRQPPINDGVTIDYAVMLLPMALFLLWPIIYYFGIYKKKKEEAVQRILNSPEYRQQCAYSKWEAQRQQQEYDTQYELQKKYYETTLLPRYQKELDQWKEEHGKELRKTEEELAQCKNELETVYGQSRMIPLQYRSVYALEYIYGIVSTSDYDVRQAIESFDRHEQRLLEEQRIRRLEEANQLQRQQIAQQEEANYLAQEANDIADQARRDARTQAFVSAVQRHRTNTILRDISQK